MSSETNAKLYEKLLPNNYQKKLTQKNIFVRVYILLKTSCFCQKNNRSNRIMKNFVKLTLTPAWEYLFKKTEVLHLAPLLKKGTRPQVFFCDFGIFSDRFSCSIPFGECFYYQTNK